MSKTYTDMFWGLLLEPGKRVRHQLETPYHLTMAAIEPKASSSGPNKAKHVSVLLESNNQEFIICNLNEETLPQQSLDLVFSEGDEVTFFINGENNVHLTGYCMPEDEFDDDLLDDKSDIDFAESPTASSSTSAEKPKIKRKAIKSEDGASGKKIKLNDGTEAKSDQKKPVKSQGKPKLDSSINEEDDEDEDEDDDSDDINMMMQRFDDDEDDDEDDEDEENDENEEDDDLKDLKSSEEDSAKKPGKQQQGQQKQQKKGLNTTIKTPNSANQNQNQNQNHQGKRSTPHPQKVGFQANQNQTPKHKLPQHNQGKKPFHSGGKGGNQNLSGTKQGGKFKNFQKKPWMSGKKPIHT